MHTEKTRLQHQIWPQKRGQFLDLQFAPFPIEGWFWGPLVGPRNGPRNSVFFLLLLPYHLGLNIWPAWPQLQRFSACQTGFTTKGPTCSKCPCTIIIICDQHSYYDCKHTHTHTVYIDMGVSKNRDTPESSILIGFSIINHPFWGYPYSWKHPYTIISAIVVKEKIKSRDLTVTVLGLMTSIMTDPKTDRMAGVPSKHQDIYLN